jgi:fructan beta-fructosidase
MPKRISLTLCLLAVVSWGGAVSQPSKPNESYNEPQRPQYHFTPAKNFMNDPNGLVYYKGEYHLFYQHNPFGNTWGHMSWGHAVSRDLVRWEHLPVALAEENGEMIFSGSAVVDWNNTSGLCRNSDPQDKSCLVAVYTGHTEKKQVQNIAYSNDRGRTWTKYAGNPVIDVGLKDFRDPKVIWHAGTKKWVMAVALPHEHKVRFYSSPDLKRWAHLSDFGPAGVTSGIWECPDLFEMTVEGGREKKWVLIVNMNPGGAAGGSGGQYFVGHFDGTKFTNDNPAEAKLYLDYGKDFYAAVTFSDAPDGRRILLGWMSNWQYANKEPTTVWRCAQSLPRVLTLRQEAAGLRLVQQPVETLKSLRADHWSVGSGPVEEWQRTLFGKGVTGDALEILAEFEIGGAVEVGLEVRKSVNETTRIGYDAARREVFIDRTRSGNANFDVQNFPGRHAAPLTPSDNRVRLHVFVDRSSVEVFADGGRVTLTDRIFPSPQSQGVELYAKGGGAKCLSMEVWRLKSAWVQ